MANIIGKVALLQGQAYAKGADRRERPLKVGDVVFEGDVIVTAANSRVEIAFEAGQHFLVRGNETVTLDKAVLGNDLPEPRDAALIGRVAEPAEIARVIAEGGSLDGLLEETAAGFNGGAANDGHGFVEIGRILEGVTGAGDENDSARERPLSEQPTSARTATAGFAGSGTVSVAAGSYTDAAGNPGTGGGDTVAIDTVAPVPSITLAANVTADDIVNAAEAGGTVTITGVVGGDARAGDTVTLTVNGVSYTGLVAADLSFAIPVAGSDLANDPDHTIEATVTTTDAAGNVGTASATDGYRVNTPPVAVADTGSGSEDATSISGDVTPGTPGQDYDADGDPITVIGVAAGSHPSASGNVGVAVSGIYGTVVIDADGTFNYVPGPAAQALGAGQTATDVFTYTIGDGTGDTSTATLTITLTGANDAPTITGPLTGTVTEDGTTVASGTLTVSDPDAGQSSFVAQSGTIGTYGTFSITAAGVWTYTLNNAAANVQALRQGQSVSESFTITTADGTTRSVVITVNGTNDAPVAVADTAAVVENATVTASAATGVLANDTDVDAGDTKTVTGVNFGGTPGTVGSPLVGTYGTLTLNADGSYSYVANRPAADALAAGQTATEVFTYTLRDAAGATATGTLTFTVTGTNDVPVAVADVATAVEAGGVANGTPGVNPTGNVLANDTDVDGGDTKTVTAVSGVAAGTVGGSTAGNYGTLVLNGDGSYTYTVNNNHAVVQALRTSANTLTDTFTYTMRDAAGATSTATLTVTIQGANDAPVAGADTAAVVENATVTASAATGVLANDTDVDAGDTKTVSGVSFGGTPGTVGSPLVGTYGTLTLNADGSYSYVANRPAAEALAAGQSATETFSYTMRDAAGATSSSTLTFTVTGTNDAPVAVADTVTTNEDTALTIPVATLLANDSDVDGGTLTITSVQGATHGTVTLSGGNVIFTPAANYSGPASFTYTLSDGQGGTATGTVTVNVTPVADQPMLFTFGNLHVLNPGATTISTGSSDVVVTAYEMGAGVSQANLETELGVASGYLDNRFDPTGPNVNDPGFVNVVDGKLTESHYTMKSGMTVTWDYSFRNGEDLASEVASGFNDVVVLMVTDPLGNKQSYLVDASEEKFPNQISNGSYGFTATMDGHYTFQWLVLNSGDAYKDSSLQLSTARFAVAGDSSNYGAPIALPVLAKLNDTDGSEVLAVTISDVPAGARFNAGTDNGGGTWTFSAAELPGLTLLPPATYTGTMNLTVTATATETANGHSSSVTQNVSIAVSEANVTYTTSTQAGETLAGSAGNDLIRGYAGNDTVNANDGNDLVYGGAGNDTLNGGNGNDWLFGGVGTDTLNGGAGNDVLFGGAGNDTLTGGTGADVFAWTLTDRGTPGTPATDTVTDFDNSATGDRLDLRDLLVGETSENLANYLHFTTSGGNTTISVSTTGGFAGGYTATAVDQVIQLNGVNLVGSFTSDQQVIQDLLSRGKLVTD